MRFEDLDVWKRAARLSVEIYKASQSISDFGFRDQLTRSGLSVPSNIAEGYERAGPKEFARFLSIAKGSCGEVRTQIYIGMEIGYLSGEKGKVWLRETGEISKILHQLIESAKLRQD